MSYRLTLIYVKSDLANSSKTHFNSILSTKKKTYPSFAWHMVNKQWLVLQISYKDQIKKLNNLFIEASIKWLELRIRIAFENLTATRTHHFNGPSYHTYCRRRGTRWQSGEPSRYTDSLRVGRSAVRTPANARHSVPLQSGPEATQRSCTMCTGSLSRE